MAIDRTGDTEMAAKKERVKVPTTTFKDATVLIEEAAKMYRNLGRLVRDPEELQKMINFSGTVIAESTAGSAEYSAGLLDQLAEDLREVAPMMKERFAR